MEEARLEIQVEVEISRGGPKLHLAFFEQRVKAFRLLGSDHDNGGLGESGGIGKCARPSNERLHFDPAQVKSITVNLTCRYPKVVVLSEGIETIERDDWEGEATRELSATGLRCRQHFGLLDQRPRIRPLALGFKVEDEHVRRQVVKQRGAVRVQV